MNPEVMGVIFDLDGTLIDSYEAIYLSFKYAYEKLGLPPLSYEEVKKAVGLGLGKTFRDLLGEERVAPALSYFFEKYEAVFRTHTRILPDVPQVLNALHTRGIPMAVASNKVGNYSRAIFKHFQLEKFFVVILGEGDVSQNKPDPEMIYCALGKMAVEKEHAVFVGDSVVDIRTARNIGMRVFAVPTGNTDRSDLEKAGPTYFLDRLLDLLNYV